MLQRKENGEKMKKYSGHIEPGILLTLESTGKGHPKEKKIELEIHLVAEKLEKILPKEY